jgi:hypothetical protein
LRGRVVAHRDAANPLLEAKRPQNPPPITRTPFDPNRTVLNRQQIELYESWSLGGTDGLSKTVFKHVEDDYSRSADASKDDDKESTTDPHRFIRDDFNSGRPKIAALLVCMHRQVLDGLLNGNMDSQEHQDSEFRAAIVEHANLEALPCIYLIQIARSEVVEGKLQTYPGRGLTWHE